MAASRPPVPTAVRRELRQQAGFGCCVCGLPIYQYHHIVPWRVEQHFRPADMMIMCPNHHDQASKGAMGEEEQRRHRASPYNIIRGYAAGLLSVRQRYCALDVGGGMFLVGEGVLVEIDGEPLLGFRASSEGALLLSVSLYDENDDLVALIEENEWIAGDASTWDLEADWQRLTLRLGPKRVALRIDARSEPATLRGVLWRHGSHVTMAGTHLAVSGRRTLQNLGLVRTALQIDTRSGELRLAPQEGRGHLVSEPDPARRLAKSIEALTDDSVIRRVGTA